MRYTAAFLVILGLALLINTYFLFICTARTSKAHGLNRIAISQVEEKMTPAELERVIGLDSAARGESRHEQLVLLMGGFGPSGNDLAKPMFTTGICGVLSLLWGFGLFIISQRQPAKRL